VHVSDDEAADIWVKQIGIDPNRLSRLDEANFWQMGDTGPCGPCTEIFWDHGEDIPGGPPGSPDDDLDRYIEIWNLVFMQFERDASGTMTPLPKPSIDTGMGLERVAAVMQGVHSNYDIDLFQHLIKDASRVTGCKDLQDNSLKVIADHIRSCAFLIVDGVKPSNEGRGYVLRRIIRRALRHGHNLGAEGNFFYKLTASLGEIMGEAYPELLEKKQVISDTIKKEEEQFARTLDKGMGVLEAALAEMSGTELSGELVFQLYDTFGFPTDLTNDVAREKGYTLDIAGYEKCMQEQKSRARSASQFSVDYTDSIRVEGNTEFCGYEALALSSNIIGLFTEGKAVSSVGEDAEVVLVLDRTVFYAESGGQVGDSGFLSKGSAKIEITDCRKVGNHHIHIGRVLSGEFSVGDSVDGVIDQNIRQATALNHSATHLVHEALRQVLGDHVEQKGSLVDSQRLRFDFTHGDAVSNEQVRRIEHLVNEEILKNTAVSTQVMSMDDAKAKGAVALFGEKYGDEVRVVSIGGEYSVELCGGTHVSRSGDIGAIRITTESSVASGVRRIEGVTGMKAVSFCDDQQDAIADILSILRSGRQGLNEKAQSIVDDNRRLQKEIERLKDKLANTTGNDLMSGLQEIGGISVLSTVVEGADAKSLRGVADQVRSKMQRGVFMLAAVEGEKAALVAGVTQNLTDEIKASELLKFVTDQVGGKGGGRPDMAQGATGDVSRLPKALQSVYQWVTEKSG
jgi:alanyl-tRNA synthetase